jgi:hypothetical protein
MARKQLNREHYAGAIIEIGATTLQLQDYATTGLRVVTVGPSGVGKTNTGLVFAEQLALQGWVCVVMDPEGEIFDLYEDRGGILVTEPKDLEGKLRARTDTFLIVKAQSGDDFVEFGEVIMMVADELRQPIFLLVDEAQMFSVSRGKRKEKGEASDLINDMVERGRKRNLDLFFTAHRFAGTLHRAVFTNKNLCFIGRQEDPTAWQPLAPLFRGTSIGFGELSALAPGEFFCFSRRGIEKIVMPMAEALAANRPPAAKVAPVRPTTFSQWDRAMRKIPTDRLERLTVPAIDLMVSITGLTFEQSAAGYQALSDELKGRA